MRTRCRAVACGLLTLPALLGLAAVSAAAEVPETAALTYEQTEDRSNFISQVRQARQGDTESQWQVGLTYVKLGDPTRAFRILKPAAEAGHSRAATLLAWLYEQGRGTGKSLDEARRWYGFASGQGHPEAMAALGRLLQKMPETRDAARDLFQRAAELGDRDGQYHLACLLAGSAGERDGDDRAYKWFLKAAQQDHVGAQVAVAIHLLAGKGVAMDRKTAGEWLVRAARTQDPVAHYLLGRFRQGADDEKADPVGAERSYRLAAAAGHREAQFTLASLLAKSRAEGERKEAATWFARADEAGHKAAANRLGELLRDGVGDAQQMAQARNIFQRAADQGNLDSMYNLARMLNEGLGGSRDTGTALKWYARAADDGHEQASEVLAGLLNSSVKTSSLGIKGFWQ